MIAAYNKNKKQIAMKLMALGSIILASSVDSHEQKQFAFVCLQLCDIDMEEADRVALERLSLRLFAFDIWQSGDAMALQAAIERRTGQAGSRV